MASALIRQLININEKMQNEVSRFKEAERMLKGEHKEIMHMLMQERADVLQQMELTI